MTRTAMVDLRLQPIRPCPYHTDTGTDSEHLYENEVTTSTTYFGLATQEGWNLPCGHETPVHLDIQTHRDPGAKARCKEVTNTAVIMHNSATALSQPSALIGSVARRSSPFRVPYHLPYRLLH